ncbi:fructose-bisphosphate aldolase [Spirochaetota bacterium]|nr:fructose-bisphosphate aldolase [Spirochaetota bacterium]
MPIATPEIYKKMLAAAHAGRYAYPAFNIASIMSINAALRGLEASRSDGILQVSTGAGKFASGGKLQNMSLGAILLAEYIHRVADEYDVYIALHTDHCPAETLPKFVEPLLVETERRRENNQSNLFGSHMFDGAALPIDENLTIASNLIKRTQALDIILEVEIGVVGGEEDGIVAKKDAKLYTTPEDMLKVAETLGTGEKGTYMLAASFGNVHGVYKPGAVKLNPSILKAGQALLKERLGTAAKPFYLVFHGGSGSSEAEIQETLEYGVVKMNIDTDTQYAFTRPIVDQFFTHYNKVIHLEGEMASKKFFDPRGYLRKGEDGMLERVKVACKQLRSAGQTLVR